LTTWKLPTHLIRRVCLCLAVDADRRKQLS
jgi:hypothetical protein